MGNTVRNINTTPIRTEIDQLAAFVRAVGGAPTNFTDIRYTIISNMIADGHTEIAVRAAREMDVTDHPALKL